MTVTTLVSQKALNEDSLEKHNGNGAFVVLVGADGIVDAKLVDGKYGLVWKLAPAECDAYGKQWVPADGSHVIDGGSGKRSRVQVELGLQQMLEIAPAFLSRNGDICRKGDWPSYGSWKGVTWWGEDDNEIWVP